MNISQSKFVNIVFDVLTKIGYKRISSHEIQLENIEDMGVISTDALGLDLVYIQVKKREKSLGNSDIEKFLGFLQKKRIQKGLIITNSKFTDDAIESVRKELQDRIILIDGVKLAELMIQYNVGVSMIQRYEVKQIQDDYFEE